MLPNVIIGGTQKAGTTSLFRYLSDHPSICPSSIKEIEIFSRNDSNQKNFPIERYHKFFSSCKDPNLIRLEASPSYLMNAKKIAKSIYVILPNVKFIFIIREPISALLSYIEWKSVFKSDLSLDRFIALIGSENKISSVHKFQNDYNGISKRLYSGCYADLLKEYLAYFSKEQIGIFFFDNLSNHIGSFMGKVCEFIQIDHTFYHSYNFEIENKTRTYKSPVFHRAISKINLRLESFFNRYPYLRKNLRTVYHKYFEAQQPKFEITSIDTKILREFYLPHNSKLSKFLKSEYPELSLPQWLCND
jgi:hypothetical protein